MRTLFLHAGTHRTATSSIQRFLYDNRRPLQDQGILYPYGVKRHTRLVGSVFSGKRSATDWAEDLGRRCEGKPKSVHSVILSDEDIAMRRDLSPLAGLSERFLVKVVFALRRQDLWLESWYLQNTKWQWNPSLSHCRFDEFMARSEEFFWADYGAYVRHLENVFGAENVILYVFEKAQMPDGPIAAFCRCVGVDIVPEMTPAKHVNASNSALISEFMRCLPLDEAPETYRIELERACNQMDGKIQLSTEEQSTLLLTLPQRQAVMARYAEGNRDIAQRYFGRDELFFDPLPAPDAPIGNMQLPADSYELMQRLVAPFVRELIEIAKERPR